MVPPMKQVLRVFVPWAITAIALFLAFRGINWNDLIAHIKTAHFEWLALALFITLLSYILRARRWQYLFPTSCLGFFNSARVLILGFFMNNVLPARTGELVRAHLGSKVTGNKRTLVLATIASERLADGLTISLLFVLFSLGLGDTRMSHNLLYVAIAFLTVALAVVLTLALRTPLFAAAERLQHRFENRASSYALDRLQVFVNGLAPLFTRNKIVVIGLWSVVIWLVEASVYYCVSSAFSAPLPLEHCILFLVAVNFSSLIPAAPGGIGVIEAIASSVLVSIGVERELALSMVLAQHMIQYIVVGIPGGLTMITWKGNIRSKVEESACAYP